MTRWRAFVGCWGEWAQVDVDGLAWDRARDLLVEDLEVFRDETCPDCCAQGITALCDLSALEPDHEYRGEVDGHDYILIAHG